jgi:drug/metabolite transporter (DMT)-like permease
MWGWAILAGTAFGAVAFFSVFIFMFKGRTATFAGLVNRLTSLIAGTAATLIFFYSFGGKFPAVEDWISLVFILIAVAFISKAEKKRIAELKALHELPDDADRINNKPDILKHKLS